MHYVRLLRPPKLIRRHGGLRLQLVLAVTTDLGDALLCPEEALDLVVRVRAYLAPYPDTTLVSYELLPATGKLQWRAGDRVVKPMLDLPPAVAEALAAAASRKVELSVSPTEPHAADGLPTILEASSQGGQGKGLVMPVSVALSGRDQSRHVCTRSLHLGPGFGYLELEEDLGDSIARHVWDASPVALAALAGACDGPCLRPLRRLLPLDGPAPVNVLELGCGVGILGAGLCALRPHCTVLMTDLDDAEDRARANINLLGRDDLLYESLDWNDGRRGVFGPLVRSRRWDLVMLSDCTYNTDSLPALVATLSALHHLNVESTGGFVSKAWIATKPRHDSERVVLTLLADDGWKTVATQTLPMPVLGGEAQTVEMYLFEKSGG
ncbi:hypothetical protein L249_2585 [Ophiocordyceps polyrhachis-furcata BCC 54312]|uniref:Methyltransferase small domain-containing protein n=1 Tax=Ophiocordyceps polyrhachis-furcata BCC 54312 TaxID=1330021 RepID=A0A367LP73_9HYPO|nr:hypothetical protein L249_2585 [Ophiocordyceps polyrhachis-furcata BCC 54312]